MSKYRPEPERFFEKIDKRDDGCWIWTAHITPNGYGNFRLHSRRQMGAHRWSYQHHKGAIPAGMYVDHMCFNRACVNPEHLRLATNRQNQENRSGLDSNNKSGYRGVYFCKNTRKWEAAVKVEGKRHFLGRYPTAEEAGEVARAYRLQVFTHNLVDRAS